MGADVAQRRAARSSDLFRHPTSAVVCGPSRPFLNWIAYALVSETPSWFFWTDVRSPGQGPDETGPLAKGMIPAERLHVLLPSELARSELPPDLNIRSVLKPDGARISTQDLTTFLRLPQHTQKIVSLIPADAERVVIVLTNAQRMVALYPTETVGGFVRAIVKAGASFLVTFSDAPGEKRLAFDYIFHLKGEDPRKWEQATLFVERGKASGVFHTGSELHLSDIPAVSSVLRRELGPSR